MEIEMRKVILMVGSMIVVFSTTTQAQRVSRGDIVKARMRVDMMNEEIYKRSDADRFRYVPQVQSVPVLLNNNTSVCEDEVGLTSK